MSIDEDEVTREPFEEQTNDDEDESACVSSWRQPRYDSQMNPDTDENQGLDTTDDTLVVQDGFDGDDSSSVGEEDIEYAKSFGIHLKGSKSQAGYERLIQSDLFESGSQRTGVQTDNADKKELFIKTSITSDCIYHKGCFYQKGDIVALCDQDDGLIYFAQITGFLQDQYCEKSASVNWLVPIRPTSRKFFDPSAYKIGLEDVQLRKLDCMTFVRHCPHDYYIRKFFQTGEVCDHAANSFSKQDDRGMKLDTNYKKNNKNQSYIWTTMRPCSVPTIETTEKSSVAR